MTGAEKSRKTRCLLLDWGDTVMRVFPEYEGPMNDWPRVEAIEGAAEVLEELRQRGWTIALATNAVDSEEEAIRSALTRAGLDQLFDRIFCFRRIGRKKSEPEYFETVLAELEIEPHRAVMVGDDFEGDVLAANRCGIRAVWYDGSAREARSGRMYRTIRRFSELTEALRVLVLDVPTRGKHAS